MSISYVQDGDSGLVARTLINQAIEGVNNGTLPYTGSAQITGSLRVTGSTASTDGFIGNLTGDVTGNLTGDVVGSVRGNASTATTASYTKTAESASYATTASYALNGGSTNTGSLLMTASVSLNTITFTKGNGTTFPITVNTGSGGGGSSFPYTGSAIISGSLRVTGSVLIQNADISNGGLVYYSTSSGVINQTDYVFDGSGKITGGIRTTLDLSTAGTTSGNGLVLPLAAPTSPIAGSTYFDAVTGALNVYDGSQWLNTRLMP